MKTYEEAWTDADLEQFVRTPVYRVIKPYPSDEVMREQYHPRYHPPEAGTMPEPGWWAKDDGAASVRHPLVTEEEVVVELPTDATLKELEEQILKGMPRQGRGRHLARPRREGAGRGEGSPEGSRLPCRLRCTAPPPRKAPSGWSGDA